MADTRWEDPDNWTFANCSDNTKQPLISHLWETWKEAADEHVAFTEASHEGGFTAANTFPDLIGNLVNFGAQTPKNAVRIENAIYPEKAIETSTINSSGTFTGVSDFPDDLTLSELLTGPLSYASGTLLHITETDSGDQNALFRMPWFVQQFEVMDYPEYYNRFINTSQPYLSAIEEQFQETVVEYKFNTGTATFISATAFVTTPKTTSTPVDKYIANDLNESAPFSSDTAVRDYADSVLAANSSTWDSGSVGATTIIGPKILLFEDNTAGVTTYRATLTNRRVRFKVEEQFRATSPDKFDVDVWWNGYYKEFVSSGGDPLYDFGSGETDLEMQFFKMSKVGDWYYLELVQSGGTLPDYTGYSPPGTDGDVNTETRRISFSPGNNSLNAVFFGPNVTDGTGFEFYTPAP